MKNITIMLCLLVPCFVSAQKIPDFGTNKVRIIEADRIIEAETIPVNATLKPDTGSVYYWYSNNKIHSTQGGFSGKLLNGPYNEFYLDRNIKQQGRFEKGLKSGVWKNWKKDGTLVKITTWKRGMLLPDSTVSFWKKLNIFKKKKQSMPQPGNQPKAT